MNPPAEQGAAVEAYAAGSASGNLGWTLLPALLPIAAHQVSEGIWMANIAFIIL